MLSEGGEKARREGEGYCTWERVWKEKVIRDGRTTTKKVQRKGDKKIHERKEEAAREKLRELARIIL